MRWIRLLMSCSFAVSAASASTTPSVLTPPQVQYLTDMRAAAAAASKNAEQDLLKQFGSVAFKTGLMMQGGYKAWPLASMRAADLLARVKGALETLEYVTNFGVDPAYQKAHPGEPVLDFATIEKFGHIPNMWELRAQNSPLVNGTSEHQWEIMEAAERGLYQFPLSSSPLPVGPNPTEALERPHYLGGNLRRVDVGLGRWGPYSAVVRNDVVRERAALLAGDSGGWENACNSSMTPIHKWKWYDMLHCDAVLGGKGKDRPVPGTVDHQLHTILGNTDYFDKLGGSLSRFVYQLLTPKASATPFETLLYTEAGLLGPLRPQDMKMIVASFAEIFGTPRAAILQKFCVKHRIPLAWALFGGETFADLAKDPAVARPHGRAIVDVGPDRILDPSSIPATNATLNMDALWKPVWSEVHDKVAKRRASPEASKLKAEDFKDWWNQVAAFGVPIHSLRQGDCASADLCFGTYRSSKGAKDCLCKLEKTDGEMAVASSDVESLLPESVSVEAKESIGVVVV